MFVIVLFSFALVAAGTNILFSKKPMALKNIIGIFLLYILLINVGLGGLFAFCGHAFRSAEVAASIGWQTSPFQYEIAIANLGLGVLGVLCLWLRGNFWTATVIYGTVFGIGAGIGHIRQMIIYQNYAPNNAGVLLWFGDLFLPILMLTLLGAHNYLENKKAGE
ncbi:MAG: DUF6790 family protein [Candidatus Margulisiibacteriota bacterium]|nr:DUF6790 family protein [Candidatus Margulisiibacteriota bacterium]